jgi:hypothetical protein
MYQVTEQTDSLWSSRGLSLNVLARTDLRDPCAELAESLRQGKSLKNRISLDRRDLASLLDFFEAASHNGV